MSEIRAQLDKIVKALTGEGYAAELKAARQAYYAATGEIFEDDASFETRMITFLEWFVFDRPLVRGVVPIRAYLEDHGADLSPEKREMTEALLHQRHGLYRVKKAKPPALNLKDLWDGKPIRVEAGDAASSFQPDDLLGARPCPERKVMAHGRMLPPARGAHLQAESRRFARRRGEPTRPCSPTVGNAPRRPLPQHQDGADLQERVTESPPGRASRASRNAMPKRTDLQKILLIGSSPSDGRPASSTIRASRPARRSRKKGTRSCSSIRIPPRS
jgi:hypothetical protein